MKTMQRTIIELNQEESKTFNSAYLLLSRVGDNVVRNDCEELILGNTKIDIVDLHDITKIIKLLADSKIEIC